MTTNLLITDNSKLISRKEFHSVQILYTVTKFFETYTIVFYFIAGVLLSFSGLSYPNDRRILVITRKQTLQKEMTSTDDTLETCNSFMRGFVYKCLET